MRDCHNFLDSYLDFTSGHESTRRVRLWCAVSIVAAALERKVWLDRGYYTLFPNLYTFIIGKSGLVKKSTSTAIAVNLLRECDVRIMSERLTAATLIEQLTLSGKQYEANHKQFRHSSLFAYASELSVFLEEVFGAITPLLTTFYDCVPNDSTKPWIYGTIGRGERKIYGPCLNILGASTKAWLKNCIPTSEIEGGFTSRVIFVVEENLPDKLVAWPSLKESFEIDKLRLIADLKRINALTGSFSVTDEAKEVFSEWYEAHMRNVLPNNSDPRMVGYMSRKGDTILKLAMVHSAARSDGLEIALDDLGWANRELDALEKDWRNAFESVGIKSSLSYEIIQVVRNRGIMPKQELFKQMTQTSPMAEVLRAVRDLKEMGELDDLKKEGTEYYVSPGYLEMIKAIPHNPTMRE